MSEGKLSALIARGDDFLICRNMALPFPDETVDAVFSNGVPIDVNTWLGPGVQSQEIQRILKPEGEWQHDGLSVYTKP
jgi:ubiquinone/menaquinone biosynthesis C-methylase UbiE